MRFAFVTPRYGAEIAHGAEHGCRLLAEHLSERHDVDVFTTCASDPLTWRNEYEEGVDRVRGVLVRRFAVSQPHDRAALRELSARMVGRAHGRAEEREWVRRLGPVSPALIDHLKRQHRSYDAVVFFSLCHATTVEGVAAVPDRSVLIPWLQLDPVLRFGIWIDVFRAARATGYMSSAEQHLAHAFLPVPAAGDEVVGIGVDVAARQTYPRHQQDPADEVSEEGDEAAAGDEETTPDYLASRGVLFRRRHRLYGPFALHGGRLEMDNGSEEMLDYFDSYAEADGDTALVLMGVKLLSVPDAPYLRLAGVLPERERMPAFEAADVVLAPDSSDLTARVVLESFAVGTPVLATAGNDAAVEHCRRANAGLYYAGRGEFVEALRLLMSDRRLRERLGENGRRYVRQHFRWDAVLGRFERLVSHVRRP
jgi:glycosyltransferase involved in cell wall biosynthesis